MASIDKTYVNTWEEYKTIKEWAIKTDMIYPNGINGGKMINWFYFPNLTENDFKEGKEIALWNTSENVDIFLYKNCPFKLIQDRLKEQYGDTLYLNKESIDEHEIGNHFSINSLFIRNAYYAVEVVYKGEEWRYSKDYNRWSSLKELGPYGGTCVIYITSKKSLARKIRKWNLPKETIIYFSSIKYYHNCKIIIRK